MDCTRARFLVYAYLDRELPRNEGEALHRHLATCPSCAARSRSARHLIGLLRSRLDYATAPIGLRERLHAGMSMGQLVRPVRPRYAPLGLAASILLLLLPLVAGQASPRSAAAVLSMAVPVAVAGAPIVPISRQMTGTFVCLQCEGRHGQGACPLDEPVHEKVHELGFCADNGETFRMMTNDTKLAATAVGQTVTVEGVTFPQSGFMRASRVGY